MALPMYTKLAFPFISRMAVPTTKMQKVALACLHGALEVKRLQDDPQNHDIWEYLADQEFEAFYDMLDVT